MVDSRVMAITTWSIFRAQDGEANSVPANDDSSATWIYSLQVNRGGRAKYARPLAAAQRAHRGAGRRGFPACLQARLALPLRALARLDQDEEPGSARGKAGGGGGSDTVIDDQ